MTKNVTLRLPVELLRELRHRAVDEGLSLSAWLAKHFKQSRGGAPGHSKEFERARRSAIARLKKGLPLGGDYLSRDESHDR